jgi:hypothetical protein
LLEGGIPALGILHLPIRPAEIELIAVAVEVLWRDVVKRADDSTL